MTGLTFDPGFHVLTVIESHEGGYLVNANPLEIPILLGVSGQFLLTRRFGRNGRMTLQAFGGFGHIDHLARVGIRVTHLAGLLQIAHVQLVIEGNRLLWSAVFPILRQCCGVE